MSKRQVRNSIQHQEAGANPHLTGPVVQPGHTELIASLNRAIDDVLYCLTPSGLRCAHIGFPTHWNVGDQAIWLGEKDYLRKRRANIVYTCSSKSYRENHLRDTVRNDVILLHGGGYLGDVWPGEQQLVESVVSAFPNNPIVILPQSVHFSNASSLARARAIFDGHPNLTVLVRDRQSLDLVRNEFKSPAHLCPDMALALGPLSRHGDPTSDILWLSRGDGERLHVSIPAEDDVEQNDWAVHSATQRPSLKGLAVNYASQLTYRRLGGRSTPSTFWTRSADLLSRQLARRHVDRGRRILSRGRVVVTERLHGHILSVLMGIPHVALDNSYGKVRSFYETWTSDCDFAHWADSPAEALAHARRLVRADDRAF